MAARFLCAVAAGFRYAIDDTTLALARPPAEAAARVRACCRSGAIALAYAGVARGASPPDDDAATRTGAFSRSRVTVSESTVTPDANATPSRASAKTRRRMSCAREVPILCSVHPCQCAMSDSPSLSQDREAGRGTSQGVWQPHPQRSMKNGPSVWNIVLAGIFVPASTRRAVPFVMSNQSFANRHGRRQRQSRRLQRVCHIRLPAASSLRWRSTRDGPRRRIDGFGQPPHLSGPDTSTAWSPFASESLGSLQPSKVQDVRGATEHDEHDRCGPRLNVRQPQSSGGQTDDQQAPDDVSSPRLLEQAGHDPRR
jgi:hypothetical protein